MQFHFDKAFKILLETYPFVLLRLGVYGLAVIATVAWFVGVFFLFQNWPFPGPSWLAWIFGAVLWGNGAKLLRNYVLYLVKSAHIAVVTEFVLKGGLPSGVNQLSYGKDVVAKYFVRVSVFFAVDQLVRVVLKAFNRTIFEFISFIPGSQHFKNFSQRVLDYSLGYVDEAILSYSIVTPHLNPWASAKEGLILYVQNWKTILGSGFILALISYAVAAVFAVPGALIAYTVPGPVGKIALAAGVGLGVVFKFALMDPFALVSVIANYHYAIQGQSPDPAWGNKLGEISSKFREFDAKSKAWGGVTPGPPPAPAGS